MIIAFHYITKFTSKKPISVALTVLMIILFVVYFDQRLGAAQCAPQRLVEIVIFSDFCAKKLKKARNLQQNFAKTRFFKFSPECWSTVLIPKKQCLGCAGPKRWSKYTTIVHSTIYFHVLISTLIVYGHYLHPL